MTSPRSQPIVLSAAQISAQSPETFDDPRRGDVTWCTLISQPATPSTDLAVGIATCASSSGHLCPHRHTQAELYYIIEGQGIVTIDGTDYDVDEGATVFIPGDSEHGVRNEGLEPLRWLYVFPTSAFGDVNYRFSHETGQDI